MGHKISAGIGMAAGGFLTASLVWLATGAVAHADGDDGSPGVDTDFISNTMNFGLFTDTVAADPDDHEFVANVISNPMFTDILTSGADPSDSLGFGAAGIGVSGETVNTFESTMFPFLDSTSTLPFTDPLAAIFTALIPFGF